MPDYSWNVAASSALARVLDRAEQRSAAHSRSITRPALPPFGEWLHTVTPRYCWEWDYLRYIRRQLDRVTSGEIKRLMLFLPPRHGKTEMVTVRYPVFRLEDDPETKVIVGAYNQTLANKFSRKSRRIARERIAMSTERDAVEDWETNAGGGMRAVGVGSGITGQGGNLIIIDDPVKSREEANSEAYRERCWDWYKDDLYTRLEPGGAIILIMTRWHHDDLAGRLLAAPDGGDWTVISLPAIAGADDPLGRAPGEALCPDRFPIHELEKTRTVLASSFVALYQQRPTAEEGALFKRSWFGIHDQAPERLRWVRYWDLAVSTKDSADYTCGAKCAFGSDGTLWIADVARGRWEWPDALAIVQGEVALDGKACTVGIEDAGQQRGFWQMLMREPSMRGVPLRAIKVTADKRVRASAWQARAEGGKVALVRGGWNARFLDEVCSFPVGEHDDQVDAVSGAVAMLTAGQGRMQNINVRIG